VTGDGPPLPQRLAAEAIGTGLLLAAVVGSGIMAERLAGGNVAVALLANTIATAGALVALILTFGPVSGAHFNPAVTLALAARGALPRRLAGPYLAAQLAGAVLGVWLAHLMFDLPVLQASGHARASFGEWVGEVVATFALLAVVWSGARHHPQATPYAVACVVTAGYWFTSSTSFANPAVTVARALSDTFAGIRPADVPAFVLAQAIGAAAATALFAWFAAEAAPCVSRRAVAVAEGAGSGDGGG
jgi:glycerol uptake facilitator-like aquaporin